jgi:aspartate-semialdehyde dehydrogenase
MSQEYSIAIVGATGAVGREMLEVLHRRQFPVGRLKLLASARSAGKTISLPDQELCVEELTAAAFADCDLALFSAGGDISRHFAVAAVEAGCVVVDNSSAFRLDPGVPLVIPEINPEDARTHRGILANPNCTTAITLMGLNPLHQAFGVRRVIAASYQAVSGSGAQAMIELDEQTRAVLAERTPIPSVYPHQIAFNVIPQVDSFLDTGYTKEEMKMQNESRRILHLPDFVASVTCVRVPVFRSHSVAVTAQFTRPVDLAIAREVLREAPGLQLVDEPEQSIYPLPIETSGHDDCQIGRLRLDCALENALSFWISGDQLLKGAALNAVQIAELVLEQQTLLRPPVLA